MEPLRPHPPTRPVILLITILVTLATSGVALLSIGLPAENRLDAGGPPNQGNATGASATAEYSPLGTTVVPLLFVIILALASLIHFSRITREHILENERRRVIYEHVHARPGTHFRQMRDDLGIATGVLMHHLRTLERESYLRSYRIGGKRLFFPAGVRPSERDMRDVILDEVRREPGISQAEVARRLNISRMLVHYYVRALVVDGRLAMDLEGPRSGLYPASGSPAR